MKAQCGFIVKFATLNKHVPLGNNVVPLSNIPCHAKLSHSGTMWFCITLATLSENVSYGHTMAMLSNLSRQANICLVGTMCFSLSTVPREAKMRHRCIYVQRRYSHFAHLPYLIQLHLCL